MLHLPIRPRRNRKSAVVRDLIAESSLSASHLIYPMFVQEGDENTPIESLPGCKRWSIEGIVGECARLYALGIRCVDLFAVVPEEKKDAEGSEAWNPEGVVPRAIRAIKAGVPSMCVMTDVALDPFNTYGQDGIVREYPNGSYEILNDKTVDALCRQVLCHARAGADIISPSDMMDGRIAAMRSALDAEGFTRVSLLSYTAKYASSLYGPFRGALGSAPKFGDKKTYQMDPANRREAMREAELDIAEGADMLMVKPATLYLDVISDLHLNTHLPIAAYHVSGEYLMLKAAAASGWLDEKAATLETLLSIRRAGADMILTYAAPDVAAWLAEES
ncbi:MAG TPA: porphobilinogen synthase [Candidatus Akkermansia intestinavium]|nr:porphobilinogen synthase [Candidatus Akkermansia intestinavium]